MKYVVLIIGLFALICNCASVIVEAPSGRNVTLQSETTETGHYTSMKCWYFLWGLVPISNNSTADLIATKNYSSVKVKTYYSFLDWFLSSLTGGLVMCNTVAIQGQ